VELRPLTNSDYEFLVSLQRQDDVWEFIGTLPLPGEGHTHHLFAISEGDLRLGFAGLVRSHALEGEVLIAPFNDLAEAEAMIEAHHHDLAAVIMEPFQRLIVPQPGFLQGVRAITDYNGVNGFGRKPDIVTMNNAHSTHFTDDPEEGITYVLRGWPSKPGETEAKHDITLKDMKVWNVPTNARDWGSNAARINGNSIFIFAIGDLCIAHLGHLHHRLTKEHLDELGRIDVLMVPIDGSFTMGVPLMVDVIKQIQPKVVLPMHYWGRSQVERFQGLMQPLDADFVWPDRPALEVVREELPEKLTVIVLGGNGGD